jgi:hypothetical protein
MSTINPILNSVAQTAYANQTAPVDKTATQVQDRDQVKASSSGNTTVTLSELGLQKSQAEKGLRTEQFVKERESVEQTATQSQETENGLAYGSQQALKG